MNEQSKNTAKPITKIAGVDVKKLEKFCLAQASDIRKMKQQLANHDRTITQLQSSLASATRELSRIKQN